MKSRTTSRSRITQHSKRHSSSSSRIIMDGSMVVAGSTYYHARVLCHHPWRATDTTVYKSSKLIPTYAAVFP